jgi:hypothetical protein
VNVSQSWSAEYLLDRRGSRLRSCLPRPSRNPACHGDSLVDALGRPSLTPGVLALLQHIRIIWFDVKLSVHWRVLLCRRRRAGTPRCGHFDRTKAFSGDCSLLKRYVTDFINVQASWSVHPSLSGLDTCKASRQHALPLRPQLLLQHQPHHHVRHQTKESTQLDRVYKKPAADWCSSGCLLIIPASQN